MAVAVQESRARRTRGPEKQQPAQAIAPRTFAYLRVSTSPQDVDSQKIGVLDYAKQHSLPITRIFEETASGRVPAAERVLGKEVIPALQTGDALIVAEISRLGRSVVDILSTLKVLSERQVCVHVAKSGFVLDDSLNSRILTTVLSLTAEIERELLRQRVREGQARAKAAGKRLGRPKAEVHVSKLDKHADLIRTYASRGMSKLNLARAFDCDWGTINKWLQRHGVTIARKEPRRSRVEVDDAAAVPAAGVLEPSQGRI